MVKMSESHGPQPPERKQQCPRCNSHNVQRRGERNDRWRYRCKGCGKWFKEDLMNQIDHDDILDVFNAYCFDVTALDRINSHTAIAKMKERGKDLPESKTNWSDFLIREAECLESGPEITRTRRESMGGILIIDSMHRKIEKEKHYFWLAIDATSGDPVHYDVTADKTLPTVTKFLYELRLKGDYEGIMVVSDQEKAILSAVEYVFPHAKLQGCVVHRMRRLYKKLPTTQRKGRRINSERIKIRAEFIELACRLIHSATPEEKQRLTQRMKSREAEWAVDTQTLMEYENLMRDLDYYLTAQERGQSPDNTNQVESANDLFSKFVTRRQGFKNLRAARAYLKAFFAVFRLKREGTIGRKESPYLLAPPPAPESGPSDSELPEQTSKEAAPELKSVPQAVDVNIGTTPIIIEQAKYSGDATLDTSTPPVAFQSSEQSPPESAVKDNLTPNATRDEMVLKIDQLKMQILKDTEDRISAMKSSESYCLQPVKAYVNKFERIARKLGVSPSAIAISKTDGTVTKLTHEERKSPKRCRVKSVYSDCLCQLELQCLDESFGQMIDSLAAPYYKYGGAKSYSNEFYRFLNKRGKSPASSRVSRQDGSIKNV